jgi:hypothetical protein
MADCGAAAIEYLTGVIARNPDLIQSASVVKTGRIKSICTDELKLA